MSILTTNLQVMQSAEVSLLLDLGVLDERADEGTAFTLLGMVIHDPVVFRRLLDLPPTQPRDNYAGLHAVVQAMPPAEKQALQDRVLAKCAAMLARRKPHNSAVAE